MNIFIENIEKNKAFFNFFFLFIFFIFSAFIHSALASTPISGTISQNTTWALAGSPYVLSGSVTVTNGAQLTVEAGVQIRMETNAELRIVNGSLAAQGSASNPVVFTSIHDVAGSTTLPAKGDWGSLVFENGTIDANTVLTHVEIYYGHGVVIQSASPTLHFVHFEQNIGAAISMDLQSSPIGSSLTAIDNDVNGIAVPAGEIDSNVTWAMTGIPYVVEQGILSVGKRAFSLSPSYLKLALGATATLDLDIPDPAPVGGLVVNTVSSIPSVASVPSTVTSAEGEQITSLSVNALTLGTSTITASQTGYGTATAKVDVVLPPSVLLSPQSALVGIGKTLSLTLTLSDIAPAGGTTVALTAGDPSLFSFPAQVVIPAGQKTLAFPLQGLSLGTTTLTANAVGFGSSTANVTVRSVSLDLPPSVLVAPNSSQTITLSLTDPAPTGDLLVNLSTSNPAIATVPATVTVPAGDSAISFSVSGVAQGSTPLSATASGYSAANATITVDTINLQFNPSGALSVPQNATHSLQVKLSKTAPPGGSVIALSTGNSAILSVSPPTVTVPAGQTVATETIGITGITQGATTLIAQGQGLTTANASAQVTPPVTLNFNKTLMKVGKGLKTYFYELSITLKRGIYSYTTPVPVTVNLISADPSKVTVPATVTIPAGYFSTNFRVTGVDLTSSPMMINASATGYTSPSQSLGVNVVVPVLTFNGLDGGRSTSGIRDAFYVRWYVAGPGIVDYPNYQAAANAQVINLSIAAENPVGIIPGFHDAETNGNAITQVTIPLDSYDSNYAYIDTPTVAGTYQVQADLAGLGSWTSAVQTVSAPELRFSRVSANVGKRLNTPSGELAISTYVNGQTFTVSAPLTIALTSNDPSKVTVPATVTILAGQSAVNFKVTGVDLTSAPVTINANAAGYTSPSQLLGVNVVTPELKFSGLDGSRNTFNARDNFYVYWYVAGAIYPANQTVSSTQVINLSTVAENPAGIIPGFHDAATNGNAVTQVTIPLGSNSSNYAYIDTPTVAGTYQVQADLTGIGTWTSAVQTVSSPELQFSKTSVNVGKGLNSNDSEVAISASLNGQAFNVASPLNISLSSADPTKASVPSTVTIPAGQSTVYFKVTGLDLTTLPVTINASAPGYMSPSQLLNVNVVTPELRFDVLDGNRSTTSERDNFYVYWYVPGAVWTQTAISTQVMNVSIVAANPAGIVPGFHDAAMNGNVITQVTIPSGYSSSYYCGGNCNYTYIDTPTLTGTYQVQAELLGIGTWTSAVQTVSTPTLVFSKNPVFVGHGLETHVYEIYIGQQVNGQQFSSAQPVTISLSCVATSICNAPATVTIPAGDVYTPFTIRGMGLGSTQIVATAVGYAAPNNLDVNVIMPELRFSNVPSTLNVGQSKNFSLYFNVSGANYWSYQTAINPIIIDLTSADIGVATLPVSATISTGQFSSPDVSIAGVAPGTTTVTASGANLTPITSLTITVQ